MSTAQLLEVPIAIDWRDESLRHVMIYAKSKGLKIKEQNKTMDDQDKYPGRCWLELTKGKDFPILVYSGYSQWSKNNNEQPAFGTKPNQPEFAEKMGFSEKDGRSTKKKSYSIYTVEQIYSILNNYSQYQSN
tara:strand:- start:574 stop:969 length:396 start_codon:yes stop_codon:yes gene_type:complete